MPNEDGWADGPSGHGPIVRLPRAWVEAGVGLGLAGLLGYYLLLAAQLPEPFGEGDVGAGRFPTIIATGSLIAVAIMVALAAVKAVRGDDEKLVIHRAPQTLLGAGLLFLQAYLFETIGFLVALPIAALLILLAAGERRPLHLVATPALLTLGIYLTFTLALGVHLP
jgi:hypothetical protein